MTDERKYYVYAWIREDNGTYFYIGKGSGKRYRNKFSKRNMFFRHIVSTVECKPVILIDGLTEEEAYRKERETIIDLIENQGYGYCDNKFIQFGRKYLCNENFGGYGGYKQSEETIQKRVAKNKGQKRSPEQRKRLSEAAKQRVFTEAELERIRTLNKGGLSEETKRKLSEAHKGKKLSDEHKKSISRGYYNIPKEIRDEINERRSKATGEAVYCIELDRAFNSSSRAEKAMKEEYGLPCCRKKISKVCKGTYRLDWYLMLEINGVMTKLHWKYI
ncbi:NUMOD3 domain-containing DNA-binding protein [Romboutsia ilealis]|uniref:NUMOD3 domain-containing DNA-binding protein n=1 Tax=Romboutsia ilealis TaxID=1115758 RepID=UPI00272A7A6F|nr:NUMOD3 domain-containing DNA-binding protein [Romboutsia ilealis]